MKKWHEPADAIRLRRMHTYDGAWSVAQESAQFCSAPSDPLYRSEAIIRGLFGEIDNSASWIMQHPDEYTCPVAALVERITRSLMPADQPRDHAVIKATALAMVDAMHHDLPAVSA